jgi:hypothetical protein
MSRPDTNRPGGQDSTASGFFAVGPPRRESLDPSHKGEMVVLEFKSNVDVIRCLNDSRPAWDRLAACINGDLRRYCEPGAGGEHVYEATISWHFVTRE